MESNKSKNIVAARNNNIEGQSILRTDACGPEVFQNASLYKKMVNSKRTRITEQATMPSNSVVFGNFRLTNAISEYTKSNLFNGHQEEVKIAVKFSDDTGNGNNSHLGRNPAGFSIRFHSEAVEWNFKGKSIPVACGNDPGIFSDFVSAQQKKSNSNLGSPSMFWDYMSSNPASLHHLLMVMSDRGTPVGYCHMNGYGVRTFTMVNAENKKYYVKFHFKTLQGIRSFRGEEAVEKYEENRAFAHQELIKAINERDFPKWSLKIQVMTTEQVNKNYYDPFDLTKTWPQENFPLIDVGEIELNEIPKICTDEIVKSDFGLMLETDGICISSFEEQKDFDSSKEDHYTQPQELFTYAMNNYNRENLILNIVDSMRQIEGDQRDAIINRQLSHFFRIDVELGSGVAKGLNVALENILNELRKMELV